MYPKPIQRLIELLSKLPGVGPRQAGRMVFFILRESNGYVTDLADAVNNLKRNVAACKECFHFMEKDESDLCEFCRNPKRDKTLISVVEKEADLANIEKTGGYHGLYHVLGGTFAPLDPDSPKKLRLEDFYSRIERHAKNGNTLEVIIATSQTTEGEATARYLERMLEPLAKRYPALSVSRLGRGMSMGSEIEYADETTLHEAFNHRIKL